MVTTCHGVQWRKLPGFDSQEVTSDVDQNSARRRMCLLLATIVR